MKITTKLIVNAHHDGCVKKNIFHTRLSRISLNGICLAFLSYWKISNLHLIPEMFYRSDLKMIWKYIVHFFLFFCFCLSLNFLNMILQIRLRFKYFSQLFFSLFSLIVYLVKFNTHNKDFLRYINKCVQFHNLW